MHIRNPYDQSSMEGKKSVQQLKPGNFFNYRITIRAENYKGEDI